MDTPTVYRRMRRIPGCTKKLIVYFMGHEHCNKVTESMTGDPLGAFGFMVGGAGMFGNGCSQLGVTVLTSDPYAPGGPNMAVEHIPLVEDASYGKDPATYSDGFDQVFDCLFKHGFVGCRSRHALSYRAVSRKSCVAPLPLPKPTTTRTTVAATTVSTTAAARTSTNKTVQTLRTSSVPPVFVPPAQAPIDTSRGSKNGATSVGRDTTPGSRNGANSVGSNLLSEPTVPLHLVCVLMAVAAAVGCLVALVLAYLCCKRRPSEVPISMQTHGKHSSVWADPSSWSASPPSSEQRLLVANPGQPEEERLQNMMRQMSPAESEWTTAGENFDEGAEDHGSATSSGGPRRSGNVAGAASPSSRVREVRGGKVPTSRHLTEHLDLLDEVLLPEDIGRLHTRAADTSATAAAAAVAAAAGVQRPAFPSQVHNGNLDRGHRRARSEPFSHRSEELLNQLDSDTPHTPQKQQLQQPPQRRGSPPLPPPMSPPVNSLNLQDSQRSGSLSQGRPSQQWSAERKRSSWAEDSAGERKTGGQRSSRNRDDSSSPMEVRPSMGSSNTPQHRPGVAGSRRDSRSAYSPAR